MKPTHVSNLIINVYQASGESDKLRREQYDWDFSPEEPALWPLEAYDDYPEFTLIQMFRQLNQFIRTNSKAAAFDGKKVTCDLALPEGLDYEQTKQFFIDLGYGIPTISNWLSGSRTLTISWTNYIVPADKQKVLDKEHIRVYDPSTDLEH